MKQPCDTSIILAIDAGMPFGNCGTSVMIDLHNHMLPGLDDGAADWEESVAMARLAAEDGAGYQASLINKAVCDSVTA